MTDYMKLKNQLAVELKKFRAFKRRQTKERMAYAKKNCQLSFKSFQKRWDFDLNDFIEDDWEYDALYELNRGNMLYYLTAPV